MDTYRAVADALNLTVYKNGRKVQQIERTGFEEYSRMAALLRSYGYEVTGTWDSKKLADNTWMHSVDVRPV